MEQAVSDNPSQYGPLLAIIRRRRWYVWCSILIYMPVAVGSLELTQSYTVVGIVFAIWLVLLCIVITLLASARCPHCGNTFHMRHSTLGFSRRCRYCSLHLNADRQAA